MACFLEEVNICGRSGKFFCCDKGILGKNSSSSASCRVVSCFLQRLRIPISVALPLRNRKLSPLNYRYMSQNVLPNDWIEMSTGDVFEHEEGNSRSSCAHGNSN